MRLREAIELLEEIKRDSDTDLVRIELASGCDIETALNRVVEGSTWVLKLGLCFSLEACYKRLGKELFEISGLEKERAKIAAQYLDFEAYGRDVVLSGEFTIVGSEEGLDQNYAVSNY